MTLVKSCPKLESGLRLGQEGIHACQLGPFSSPIFWTPDEAAHTTITKAMIAEKRRWIFDLLNDTHSDTPCKHCQMVCEKPMTDVRFDQLGHIDLAATTLCNLRCSFCGYTHADGFAESKYDALTILREFSPEDVRWDAAVDFNGGEPTLLKNFDDHIAYFTSRRIRVFLYTNAITYRQSVYDGLASGIIRWVCTSLDAGTPTTYHNIKKSSKFADVLENLARYAQAGSKGGGHLAVKYIFCPDNCGDDDITGFSYAMLALRPQAVWLTFDFNPLCNLPGDRDDFGGYDYAPHIAAYAKTYVMLEKHGLECEHFARRHLAVVSRQGAMLLDSALQEIERLRTSSVGNAKLLLEDFRKPPSPPAINLPNFSLSPLRIRLPGEEWAPWSLAGIRVALAPACALTRHLLTSPDFSDVDVVAILDRDPVLHGKQLDGRHPIMPYAAVTHLAPEVVLVVAPEQHRRDIVHALLPYLNNKITIGVITP